MCGEVRTTEKLFCSPSLLTQSFSTSLSMCVCLALYGVISLVFIHFAYLICFKQQWLPCFMLYCNIYTQKHTYKHMGMDILLCICVSLFNRNIFLLGRALPASVNFRKLFWKLLHFAVLLWQSIMLQVHTHTHASSICLCQFLCPLFRLL